MNNFDCFEQSEVEFAAGTINILAPVGFEYAVNADMVTISTDALEDSSAIICLKIFNDIGNYPNTPDRVHLLTHDRPFVNNIDCAAIKIDDVVEATAGFKCKNLILQKKI